MVKFLLMLIIFLNMRLTSLPQPLSFPMLFVSGKFPVAAQCMSEAKRFLASVIFGKYQVAAPGCFAFSNGKVDTLIKFGAKPALSSMFLIDVSAPSLAYDAKSICVQGLVDGIYRSSNAINMIRA